MERINLIFLRQIKGCKNKEKKKEKFLDLISEIFTSFFIIINCLFEKEKFPPFPDIKDKNWQNQFLDEIEKLYIKLNVNCNDAGNLNETKI